MGAGTDVPASGGGGELKKSLNDVDDVDARDATDDEVDALRLRALLNAGIDGKGCNCLSGLTGLPGSAGESKMEKGSSTVGAATLAGAKRLDDGRGWEGRGGGANGEGKVVGSGGDLIMLDNACNWLSSLTSSLDVGTTSDRNSRSSADSERLSC